MNVRDLIARLEDFDPEEEVVVDASGASLNQQDIAFLDVTDVNLDEEGNVSLTAE